MSPPVNDNDPQSVSDAVTALEGALQDAMTRRARDSIQGLLREMQASGQLLTIADVEFDVTIRNLSLQAQPDSDNRTQSTSRGARPAKERAVKRAAQRSSRQHGAVRGALMNAFSTPEAKLTADELRRHLAAEGLTVTTDNLHQHLGRLVKNGDLLRPRRGIYQRSMDQ